MNNPVLSADKERSFSVLIIWTFDSLNLKYSGIYRRTLLEHSGVCIFRTQYVRVYRHVGTINAINLLATDFFFKF